MKKNSKKLLVLLMAGLLSLSGCGSSDASENTAEEGTENAAEENTEDGSGNETENTSEADNDGNGNTGENNTETAANGSGTEDLGLSIASILGTSGQSDSSSGTAAVIPTTPPRPTQEELLSGERKSMVGIILDATTYSVAVQVPQGDIYYLTIPDTGVTGNLNYITIGQIATFGYVGRLEDTALLVDISDSSMITGIYVEEYAFAIKIINAVKDMDMKALSDLTNFPVFLDTGTYNGPINTSGEFEVIDSEKIFTEALLTRIANYNLFDLQLTDAGFLIGGNSAPNITFDIDEDGILGIIGICSAPQNGTTEK